MRECSRFAVLRSSRRCWLRAAGIALVHSLDEEIRRLLKYLGLTMNDDAIEKLKGGVRLSNMRERSPGHVSKGIVGRLATTRTAKGLADQCLINAVVLDFELSTIQHQTGTIGSDAAFSPEVPATFRRTAALYCETMWVRRAVAG